MRFEKIRYGDEHFREVLSDFENKLKNYNIAYDLFYFPIFENEQIDFVFDNQESDNIIICHHDYIPIEDQHKLFNNISQCDKKYVIFSSEFETNFDSNLYIINWGSCWLLERDARKNLQPVLNKKIKNKHWISLNLLSRPHRVIAGMIIKAFGLDKFGDLRLSPYPLQDIEHWQEYITHPVDKKFERILELGFRELKKHNYVPPMFSQVYPQNLIRNVDNFNRSLRSLYEQTYVEIINETTFESPGMHVTEKFLNSVYALNIPIINGPYGLVSYLESVGFDMLRDIVNHEYDLIKNPIERIIALVSLNRRLLGDVNFVRTHYNQIQPRLYNNYITATKLSTIIKERAGSNTVGVVDFLQKSNVHEKSE